MTVKQLSNLKILQSKLEQGLNLLENERLFMYHLLNAGLSGTIDLAFEELVKEYLMK